MNTKLDENPHAVPEDVLARCNDEPIETLGAVQPFAALLVVERDTGVVLQATENIGDHIDFRLDEVLGAHLDELLPRVSTELLDANCRVDEDGMLVSLPVTGGSEATVHRVGERCLVELEPVEGDPHKLDLGLRRAIGRINTCTTLTEVVETAAKELRRFTGIDRAMVYRFDEEWNGTVLAESKAQHISSSFFGLHFPASDIPPRARELYRQQRVRVLSSRDAVPARLVPELDPKTGEPVDLSRVACRAVSPIHLEYLYNMGVHATLVVSLFDRGKLWGLIACHHYEVYPSSRAQRTAVELFAEVVSSRISHLRELARFDAERIARDSTRRFELIRDPDTEVLPLLAAAAREIAEGIGADGWCASWDNQSDHDGATLPLEFCAAYAGTEACLDEVASAGSVLEIAARAGVRPEEITNRSRIAGVIGVHCMPFNNAWIYWFRVERESKVRWAGAPQKKLRRQEDGYRLSPRKSFALWVHEQSGRSEPWTEYERTTVDVVRIQLQKSLRARDATRGKRAEAALRFARAGLAAVTNALDELVVAVNARGQIQSFNERFRGEVGRWSGRTPATGDRVVFYVPHPVREPLSRTLDAALLGRAASTEIVLNEEIGSGRYDRVLRLRAVPMRAEDAVVGASIFIRDVSGESEASERERAFAERLQHAQKLESLGVMAAGIAHDFNNLLVGIRCNAEFVLDVVKLSEEERLSVVDILEASEMASELTSKMLAFAGRGQVERKRIDLRDIVETTSSLARRAHQTVPVDVRPGAEPVWVYGDEGQLRQVVLNLVMNAQEALTRDVGGTVLVQAYNREVEEGELIDVFGDDDLGHRRFGILRVVDDGQGIEPGDFSRIFEPFYSTKFAGRGLGLAAVQGIVRAHGGGIRVESRLGEGTTFEVYLPYDEASRFRAEVSPMVDAGQPALVIESDRSIRRFVSDTLSKLGYDVQQATNASEASAAIAASPYDLVVMDHDVFGLDVPGVVAKTLASSASARFVVLTGLERGRELERLGPVSEVARLEKPFSSDELAKVVGKASMRDLDSV